MPHTIRIIPIHPATPTPEGKIQARTVWGKFARWRWVMLALTQLIYYGLPWLSLNGRQAVLFDLEMRRFYIFHAVLYPQDLIYLAGLLVVAALLLFFVTTVVGRFWCGFACPQTVYTAMFMWIEEKVEGNRHRRLRLDSSAWNSEKLMRRGSKHAIWVLISAWTGLTLVGYFTPITTLLTNITAFNWGVWEIFWTGFYGLATYVHAGLLREKVCLHMCPYGRFQGSLMDTNTFNVAYDHRRGEPRQRHASATRGACVDCTWCVQVCPTGIDIRQGLQAACISCGLCIDACNEVMDKLNQPRGLIRLASLAELSHPKGQTQAVRSAWLRPRVVVYGTLLGMTSMVLALSFAYRPELRLNVIRDRGVMARQVAEGDIENVYRLQIMNATDSNKHIQIQLAEHTGISLQSDAKLTLPPAQAVTLPVTVRMAAATAITHTGKIVPLIFELADEDKGKGSTSQTRSTFVVPQ